MERHIEFDGNYFSTILLEIKAKSPNINIDKIKSDSLKNKHFLDINGDFNPFDVYSVICNKGCEITKVGDKKLIRSKKHNSDDAKLKESLIEELSRLKIILDYYRQGVNGVVYDMQDGGLRPTEEITSRFTPKNAEYHEKVLDKQAALFVLDCKLRKKLDYLKNVAKTRIN